MRHPLGEEAMASPPRQTEACVESLPMTEAEPETQRLGSILAYTTDVQPLTDSRRILFSRIDEDAEVVKDRPALISFRINKPFSDMKLGIKFRSVFGVLQVGEIAPDGPLAQSSLKPGDQIMGLDYNRTATWTSKEAAQYIRGKIGFLSILIRTQSRDSTAAEACVFKATAEEKLGVCFWSDNKRLRIRKISSRGLLGEMSVVNEGDYVQTINSMDASLMDPALASDILRGCDGYVSIRVKTNDVAEISVRELQSYHSSRRFSQHHLDSPESVLAKELGSLDLEAGLLAGLATNIRAGFVSVNIHKPSTDTKLGIKFVNPSGEKLLISSISDRGLLAQSPLNAGFSVISINNVRCHNWTSSEASESIKSSNGNVLIIARDIEGEQSFVSATSYKQTPRSSIGISFRSTGGPLLIGFVNTEGIFGNSVLNANDEVIGINGVSCQSMSPSEAVEITKQSATIVTILARSNQKTGIVLSHGANIHGPDIYDAAARNGSSQAEDDNPHKQFFLAFFGLIFVAAFIGIVYLMF